MYMLHIHAEDKEQSVLCPAATNYHAAREVWRFMVENLKEGWRVDLQKKAKWWQEGEVVESGKS
jgi:hypothetical protein